MDELQGTRRLYKILRVRLDAEPLVRRSLYVTGTIYSRTGTTRPLEGCGPLCCYGSVVAALCPDHYCPKDSRFEIWAVDAKPSSLQSVWALDTKIDCSYLSEGTVLVDELQLVELLAYKVHLNNRWELYNRWRRNFES